PALLTDRHIDAVQRGVAFSGNQASGDKVFQMRQDGQGRSPMQAGIGIAINGGHHSRYGAVTLADALENGSLAHAAMRPQSTHEGPRRSYRPAMAGKQKAVAAFDQSVKPMHVLGHGPVRRRYDGGGPGHYMVC